MTKARNESIFFLIKSLTKSEKRQFKLYVGRLGVNKEAKFLKLFNFLDKAKNYNEKDLLKSGIVKKQQLANLKSHLQKQILISLKLNPSHKNIRSLVREDLDFASILYHKGLYKQSLKILDKAKQMALQYEEILLAYEIVELEKIIESQYITGSIKGRANALSLESEELNKLNNIASKLSNLSLELYSIFLNSGFIKNVDQAKKISVYFKEKMPDFDLNEIGFREKLWYYKACLWYSFLNQDFTKCYVFATKWVDLFTTYPQMVNLNPVFFIKGYNYLLEALFYIRHQEKFKKTLDIFINNCEDKSFVKDKNLEILCFIYINIHKINFHFLKGSFEEGISLISNIESNIEKYDPYLHTHFKNIFNYKFACMYFGAGNPKKCISYLDKIITHRTSSSRQDLQCFSRILNLIAHYEAGLDENLDSQIKSTYKFLLKMNDLNEVQKAIINFIRELQDTYPHDLNYAFKKLYGKLLTYEEDIYERRSFLYLDINSWLESKINNKPLAVIYKEKYNL